MGELDEYDDPEAEAQLFDVDYALLEALQRRTGLSAAVMIDLQQKGPIYTLTITKRRMAMDALLELVTANPRDAAAIAAAQQRVTTWVQDCEWIKGVLEDGHEADLEIAETWGEKSNDDGGGSRKRGRGRKR